MVLHVQGIDKKKKPRLFLTVLAFTFYDIVYVLSPTAICFPLLMPNFNKYTHIVLTFKNFSSIIM